MKTVSIRELRAMLSRLDDVLASGGEMTITRHGTPIARIVPVPAQKMLPSHAEFRARMPKMAVPSEVYIREDRDSRG